jgi:hypothetical protein
MAFEDQHEIMFTQALLDNPTPAWQVNVDAEGKPVSVTHKKSKHTWVLGDYDERNKSYVGTRSDQ